MLAPIVGTHADKFSRRILRSSVLCELPGLSTQLLFFIQYGESGCCPMIMLFDNNVVAMHLYPLSFQNQAQLLLWSYAAQEWFTSSTHYLVYYGAHSSMRVYLTIDCSINAKLGGWKSPRLESTFSLPAILEMSKIAAASKYIIVLLRDAWQPRDIKPLPWDKPARPCLLAGL